MARFRRAITTREENPTAVDGNLRVEMSLLTTHVRRP